MCGGYNLVYVIYGGFLLLEGREVKVVSTALLICIRTVTYIHILFTKTLWFWFSQDYNDFSCFYGSEVCNVGVQ